MPEPLYRVFVRVPIPRGDFVDPPPVNWDSSKDEALWRILSKVAKTQIDYRDGSVCVITLSLLRAPPESSQLKYNIRAARFEVTVDFLIRQVAYLTEQHASQVRDELRKAAAAAKGSTASSPAPGFEPVMGHQRTTSALSVRRDSPFQRNEASGGSGTPVDPSYRPNISRNPSGNNPAFQHNLGGGSTPRPGKELSRPGDGLGHRRRISSLPMTNPTPPSPGPADSSSDDSDDSGPAQSRIIRRPPRFQTQDDPSSYGDDEEDTDPAFRAYQQDSSDLSSTLRGDGKQKAFGKGRLHRSQTSDSSTGSAALVPRMVKAGNRATSGPLSPRATQLAGRGGSAAGKGVSREGSEGTPSMSSSFSDLDDSSITQSAMVEALASGIQDGAIGSRLSLAQSISRRFIPRKGN
ncbi:hypothetical protein jhhlp_004051 [Lomentospora prolificans]|uniref:Autophagy-related protein 29 n=1 Tax=Lomentospora prolificans TaxID=41688 RepID=A0A2N3NAG7_9PEZI|nr:hypothetical protein jhhlp_004051 [Lomentospora prolificans]